MKVKEIMSRPVITIDQDSTIKECGDLLEKHDIHGVPVVHEGRVVGVITKVDIFKAILPRYPDLIDNEKYLMDFEYIEERIHRINKTRVRELMGAPVLTVDVETPICKAGSTMILKKIKQLPVMAGEELVGIVTLTDICRNLMERAPGS